MSLSALTQKKLGKEKGQNELVSVRSVQLYTNIHTKNSYCKKDQEDSVLSYLRPFNFFIYYKAI